jgi:hypothetical protein
MFSDVMSRIIVTWRSSGEKEWLSASFLLMFRVRFSS